MVFLAFCSQRKLSVSGILVDGRRSAAVARVLRLRLSPRFRNAFSSHCVIIAGTDGKTSKVLLSQLQ